MRLFSSNLAAIAREGFPAYTSTLRIMRPAPWLSIAFLLAAAAATAAVPQRLNYQGKLGNAAGDPLSGTYSFRFKLFAAETGGAALFSEDVTGADAVSVANGVYTVQIGSYTAGGIPYGVFAGPDLYLEVDVNAGANLTGAETLAPRERLNAAAWAVHALGAERLGVGAVIATFTATGALELPSGSTIAANGTLTLSTAVSAAQTGNPVIFLDRDGEVGVGTNNPLYRLDVAGAESGVDGHAFAVRNTNNASGAAASMKLITAGAAAGNPFAHFTITGVTDWTMGIQNNDADKFKITPYYILGESPGLTIDTAGRVGLSTAAPQAALDVAGSAVFGPLGNKSTFTATPGNTTFALHVASGVSISTGPLYLNAGGYIRFPDGTTQVTAGAGGSFVAKAGDTMTGALTMSGAGANVVSGSSITTTGGLFANTLTLTTPLPVTSGGTALTSAGGTANRVLRTSNGSTYALGQVIGPDIAASTIPLSALNASGCSSGQIASYNGTVWTCANDQGTDSTKVLKAGDTMTGQLTLRGASVGVSSITTLGAVGVGLIGGSNGTLVVQSTSTTAANPVIAARNNAGTELLRVQQDGNVGIGTTVPGYKLDVNGTFGGRFDATNSGALKVGYTATAPAGYYATYAP